MGNTFFSLDAADIEIELDEGINLSPGAINALRRAAVAELEGGGKTLPETKLSKIEKTASFGGKFNTALFFNNEILLSLENKHPEKLNRFDVVFAPLMSEKYTKMTNGVYIPPVIHESELPLVLDKLKAASSFGIKYALIGNLSHIPLIKDTGLEPIGDFRLNVTNSYSKAALTALGLQKIILSPELSLAMARDIGGGEIVLGKIPLMLTERCFMKENFSCAKCSCVTLCDRTGARFPMIREWQHRNIILNSIPTYMGDKDGELKRANIAHKHFLFTNESLAETVKLIDAYFNAEPLREVRRIGSRGV
jgi:putative protease